MSDTAFRQFVKNLTDIYEHIYDLVYLRSHPFMKFLSIPNQAADQTPSKERVWQLHHTLLNALQELDPGPQAPTFSREWRRHRLLVLRYVDGLTPQAVADQLAISRRHFYREHEGAIEALAEILWQRYAENIESLPANRATNVIVDSVTNEPATVIDRMQLMRLEAAQLVQIERRTSLADVLNGVLALLSDKIAARHLTIDNTITDATPYVGGDSRLVRQLLLGVIGHLIAVLEAGELHIEAALTADTLALTLYGMSRPDTAFVASMPADSNNSHTPQNPLTFLHELALLSAVTLTPLTTGSDLSGFSLTMALYTEQRSVLIVDDNEDTLELFQRYLKPLNYEVLISRTSAQLLEAAKRVRPSVIILDLMIPGQDGWDLLQILQHQPETQSIPIIICSVLHQEELALSLGAIAFLEKPVVEEKLASILTLLMGTVRNQALPTKSMGKS